MRRKVVHFITVFKIVVKRQIRKVMININMRIISNSNLRYSSDLIPNLFKRSALEWKGILQRKSILRVNFFVLIPTEVCLFLKMDSILEN